MSTTRIQQSIEQAIQYLSEHPDECRYIDKAATAVVEEGLRCRAEGQTVRRSSVICQRPLAAAVQRLLQAGCCAPHLRIATRPSLPCVLRNWEWL